jgi:hypothetical protein
MDGMESSYHAEIFGVARNLVRLLLCWQAG